MKPREDLAVYDDADFYDHEDHEFTARTHDIPFFLGQAVRAGPHSGLVDPMGAPFGDGLSPKRPDLLPYEGSAT